MSARRTIVLAGTLLFSIQIAASGQFGWIWQTFANLGFAFAPIERAADVIRAGGNLVAVGFNGLGLRVNALLGE